MCDFVNLLCVGGDNEVKSLPCGTHPVLCIGANLFRSRKCGVGAIQRHTVLGRSSVGGVPVSGAAVGVALVGGAAVGGALGGPIPGVSANLLGFGKPTVGGIKVPQCPSGVCDGGACVVGYGASNTLIFFAIHAQKFVHVYCRCRKWCKTLAVDVFLYYYKFYV